MNLLVPILAIVAPLVVSGILWWRSRNLLVSVSAFVLMMGLVAILTAREDETLPQEIAQQLQEQSSAPSNRVSDQEAPVQHVALSREQLEELRPIEVPTHGYVGSAACQECHQENHATWEASYHRKMTQLATPASVLGNFDDVHVTNRDREYILTRNDDTFYVDMPEENDASKQISVPIVMTTGSHHMQVYWFASGQGRHDGNAPTGASE